MTLSATHSIFIVKTESEWKRLTGELEELRDKYDILRSSYAQEQSKWAKASVSLAAAQSTIDSLRVEITAADSMKSSSSTYSPRL